MQNVHSPALLKMLTRIKFLHNAFSICMFCPLPLCFGILRFCGKCMLLHEVYTQSKKVAQWEVHMNNIAQNSQGYLVGSSSSLSFFFNDWVYKKELEFQVGQGAESWMCPGYIFIALECCKRFWVYVVFEVWARSVFERYTGYLKNTATVCKREWEKCV